MVRQGQRVPGDWIVHSLDELPERAQEVVDLLRAGGRFALCLDDEALRATKSIDVDAPSRPQRTSTVQPSAVKAAATARFTASSETRSLTSTGVAAGFSVSRWR
jgi:hypothetical protein